MWHAHSYPFLGGEIKQMYFIRGAAGHSIPVAANSAPTALPSRSPLSFFTSTLKNKEMTALCTNMPYIALYMPYISATLKPITAQPWEQNLQRRLQGRT